MRSGTYLGWDFGFRLGHSWWYLGLWKPPYPAHLVGQGRKFSMDDHAHVSGKEITSLLTLGDWELNLILRSCVFVVYFKYKQTKQTLKTRVQIKALFTFSRMPEDKSTFL